MDGHSQKDEQDEEPYVPESILRFELIVGRPARPTLVNGSTSRAERKDQGASHRWRAHQTPALSVPVQTPQATGARTQLRIYSYLYIYIYRQILV